MKKVMPVLCFLLLLLAACEKSTAPKEQVPIPVIAPESGVYISEQLVSIGCPLENCTVRYTLDGTDPTIDSPIYDVPFTLGESGIVKARAYKAHMLPSEVAIADYYLSVSTIYPLPEPGLYFAPQLISLLSVQDGIEIRYTLDGTEPDSTSELYTGPILVDRNTVLKVKGYKHNWSPSDTYTFSYELQVATPIFDQVTGVYNTVLSVILTTLTDGADIHVTYDGSLPDEFSDTYIQPLIIDQSSHLTAKAFREGWNASGTANANYELKALTPTYNPIPGTYYSEQTVSITTLSPGAEIHYTLDGSSPAPTSNLYSEPILLDAGATLKAIACRTGWTNSNIQSGNYHFAVPSLSFNPAGGTYNQAQNVSITCANSAAEIRYTVNGTEPTQSSNLYTQPLNFGSSTILKAKAFRTGWTPSSTMTATYTIILPQVVSDPIFNPPGGQYTIPQNVAMFCSTAGAVIRYTTDGSEPTANSMVYSSEILVNETTQFKAKAFKTGWISSQTVTANYIISIYHEQLVFVQGGTFNMGCTNGTGDDDEYPVHSVTVSSFYMSTHEVTQQEYLDVMDTNPSYFTGSMQLPVENISFYNAVVYCNQRSISEGLPPCYEYVGYGFDYSTWPLGWNTTNNNNIICHFEFNSYRLPTEAEWEYAAKGGNLTHNYIYSGSNNPDLVAWYNDYQTHPVMTKQPNELGIYDMSGNVWEFIWDLYGPYVSEPQVDPYGPETGPGRVFRSGLWQAPAYFERVAERSWAPPQNMSSSYGIRIVRSSL